MRFKFFALIALCLSLPKLLLSADIDSRQEIFNPQNHIYGPDLTATDLRGRVVLFWNVDALVSAVPTTEKTKHKSDDDSSDDTRNKNKDSNSPVKDFMKGLRTTSKGALKNGQLLLVAIFQNPTKERVEAIRQLKFPCAVYVGNGRTELYDATGRSVLATENTKDFTEGDRLASTLKTAPAYIPGRIILTLTPLHEKMATSLVVGKNIDPLVAQLMREAKGSDAKGNEAKTMLSALDDYISSMCNDIDDTLKTAPSLAEKKIMVLLKTSPMRGRRFMGALNFVRKNPEVKTLANAQTLLTQMRMGAVGKNDCGRKSDSAIRLIQPLVKSNNAAVAAEATAVLEQLKQYNTEAIAVRDNADKENRKQAAAANRENEKKAREAEKAERRADTLTQVRVTVADYMASSTAIEPFKEEFKKLDLTVTNLDILRSGLKKYETQKGEKATAAKVMMTDIDLARKGVSQILKDTTAKAPLSLFIDLSPLMGGDTERTITVNFPSLQTTTEGKAALKLMRDSEVKRLAQAVLQLQAPIDTIEGESQEENTIRSAKTKQKRLQTLLKYRKSVAANGKLCLPQLDQMGYSEDAITTAIKAEDENIKAAKKAAKESSKTKNK